MTHVSSFDTICSTLIQLTSANIGPWTIVWRTLNKIKHTAFNDNFNQNGATIYLSKEVISRYVIDIVPQENCALKTNIQYN